MKVNFGDGRDVFSLFFNNIYCYNVPDLEPVRVWTGSQPRGLFPLLLIL